MISLYHGRLAECIVIFLADSTCILEHCIMTYTMAQLSIHLAPPKSAGLATYCWLGVTHIHTHTCTCRHIHTHRVYDHAWYNDCAVLRDSISHLGTEASHRSRSESNWMDGKKRKTNYITGGCVCTGEVVYIHTAYEKASENDCQALGATRTPLGTPVIRRWRSESSSIGEKKKFANHIMCLCPWQSEASIPMHIKLAPFHKTAETTLDQLCERIILMQLVSHHCVYFVL